MKLGSPYMKNPFYCGVGQLSEAVCKYSKAREVSAAETSYTAARPTSRRKTSAHPEYCTTCLQLAIL